MRSASRLPKLGAVTLCALLSIPVAAAWANPAPVIVRAIPERFRSVWVFDRQHCVNAFPNRYVRIAADGLEQGPDLVTRRMVATEATRISVIIGQPDTVSLELFSRQSPGQGELVTLTLHVGGRELQWQRVGGEQLRLYRC
jgi:hypothetical protein